MKAAKKARVQSREELKRQLRALAREVGLTISMDGLILQNGRPIQQKEAQYGSDSKALKKARASAVKKSVESRKVASKRKDR